jgi:hypothetical protein
MPDAKDGSRSGRKEASDGSLRGLSVSLLLAGAIACSAIVYAYASSDPAAASSPPPEPLVVEKPVYIETIRYVNRTVEVEKPVYVDRTVEVEKPVYVDRIVEVEKEVPVYVNNTVVKEVPVYIEKEVEKPVYIDRPVYLEKPGQESPARDDVKDDPADEKKGWMEKVDRIKQEILGDYEEDREDERDEDDHKGNKHKEKSDD